MSWVALDRAVRAIETYGLPGPVERWRRVRDVIRHDVVTRGVGPEGHFRQHDETTAVDASLLLLAPVGIVDASDPRYVATVERIERELLVDGLVIRYRPETGVDGLPGTENPFLACSFWLVTAYCLLGRVDDAERLMARLVGLANDLGLLPEEYDPAGRFAGNFPQAYSHLALVEAAYALNEARRVGSPTRS